MVGQAAMGWQHQQQAAAAWPPSQGAGGSRGYGMAAGHGPAVMGQRGAGTTAWAAGLQQVAGNAGAMGRDARGTANNMWQGHHRHQQVGLFSAGTVT